MDASDREIPGGIALKIPAKHRLLLASVAVYCLLYGISALRYPDAGLLTPGVFLDFFEDNASLGIVSIGMTFVIISGGIDLSVGAVMSLTSVVIGMLIMDLQWPALPALLGGIALGGILGGLMGLAIHVLDMKPFIVTLAGMFFARGLGFILHLEPVAINEKSHAALASLSLPLGGGLSLPLATLLFLGTVLLAAYILHFTHFGRSVFALGGNEEAALLMGLPVGRTKIGVYTISGMCAGLAGGVLTLYTSSGSHIEGIGLELDAIAAVVIGGTLLTGGVGSVFGTVAGVLTIGLIINVITAYEATLSSGLTKVAIGLLLLAFVLIQRLLMTRSGSSRHVK